MYAYYTYVMKLLTLRESTTFDATTPGDMAWVATADNYYKFEAQNPYYDIKARVET
jgi:hypothetical protein